MKLFNAIGTKIESFFDFLNKDAENDKEKLLQTLSGLALFITIFILIGLTGTFVGA